jgi:very-short-patch-repair endonuclease
MARGQSDNPDDVERIWALRDRIRSHPNRKRARGMRHNPTDAERKLWWHMRHRLAVEGTHFRRQVQLGRYIVDFASHGAKLVIEVDGGQHAEQTAADAERTRFLEAEGYRVLRFWNNDVLRNIDGVLEVIQHAVATTPTPSPSPQGGGEQA